MAAKHTSRPKRKKRRFPLPFWRTKTLDDMAPEQWESLCDGCGKCCLHKLEHEDGEISYTSVGCRLLDLKTCRCTNYPERQIHVPDCLKLTPEMVGDAKWLPSTCAYRLLREGKKLAWWHPLVSGDPETVHEAGISVRGKAIAEKRVKKLERYIVEWAR